MIDRTQHVHSLTDFKRNTEEYIQQLKESGEPLVLTVKGQGKLIVQDAEAYQKLLGRLDYLETIEGICKGLRAVEEGRTRPAKEVFEEMQKRYGISG